eukprot:3576473-Karenia_brevis.AAC.1
MSDSDRAAALDDHHVHKQWSYSLDTTNKGDDGKSPLWIRRLYETHKIRHSAMLVVTTQGDILSRSRRGGQFAKYGCGGGKTEKSLQH